jgi:outer membrane lipoprotein-sorting protein
MKYRITMLLFLLVPLFTMAQENATLKAVQQKFLDVNSFKVTFKQGDGNNNSFSGTLYYQKENKIKVELKELTIATDGTTTWNLNKKGKKVMLSKYKASDISLISLPTLILKTPASCTVSESNEGNHRKLFLIPNKSSVGFKKAEFWVNSDNLISKFKITDSQNNDVSFALSNYQLNIPLDNSFFTYKPIEGIKTIDLR